MKKLLLTLALAVLATMAGAQTMVHHEDTTMVNAQRVLDSRITASGEHLKQSANYETAAIALSAVSGLFYSGVVTGNDDRKMANTVGTLCAVAAVACKAVAISRKYKAGQTLTISPGQVTLTF